MDSATEKLELGLQRLAKARRRRRPAWPCAPKHPWRAGRSFSRAAAADSHIPADQRAALADPKRAQWKELLDAMQLYGDLSAQNRELIWRTNGLRTKVAHGGRYTGSRAELERYAALVQSLSGYTPPAKPAGSTPRRARVREAGSPARRRAPSLHGAGHPARGARPVAGRAAAPALALAGRADCAGAAGWAGPVRCSAECAAAGRARPLPRLRWLPLTSAAAAAPDTQPPTEVQPTALPRGATVTAAGWTEPAQGSHQFSRAAGIADQRHARHYLGGRSRTMAIPGGMSRWMAGAAGARESF